MSVKLKILTKPDRKDVDSPFRFSAIGEDQLVYAVSEFCDGEGLSDLMQPGRFVLIRNFTKHTEESGAQALRLSKRTKIYEVKAFDVSEDSEQKFFHAPMLDFASVKQSPKKRRCSVVADVTEVYELRQGPKWSRRDVRLTEPKTAHTIMLKLWGDKSDIGLNPGDLVKVENVETSCYKEQIMLQSTSETQVQMQSQTETKELFIIGIHKFEDHIELSTEEDDFKVQVKLLEDLLGPAENVLAMTPLAVTCKIQGGEILEFVISDGPAAESAEHR